MSGGEQVSYVLDFKASVGRMAGDDSAPVIDVVVGQLLGFFRSMHEGLRPDSPSESGVINRVVQSFTLHFPGDGSSARIDNPQGDGN